MLVISCKIINFGFLLRSIHAQKVRYNTDTGIYFNYPLTSYPKSWHL